MTKSNFHGSIREQETFSLQYHEQKQSHDGIHEQETEP
jgi:hypothetical protein